jgi:hypothetical protein
MTRGDSYGNSCVGCNRGLGLHPEALEHSETWMDFGYLTSIVIAGNPSKLGGLLRLALRCYSAGLAIRQLIYPAFEFVLYCRYFCGCTIGGETALSKFANLECYLTKKLVGLFVCSLNWNLRLVASRDRSLSYRLAEVACKICPHRISDCKI